ncbi:MAG: hypothetical protein ACK56I_15955, partial [bacterium]
QCGLVVFGEDFQRCRIAAEIHDAPIARVQDGERDARVVLHDGRAVPEEEVADGGEAAAVHEVRCGFEVAGGASARRQPVEDSGLGFERPVGEIGLQVDDLGGRDARGRTENDAHGWLPARGFTGCQRAVALQREALGQIDARVGEGKEDEHDGKHALEMRCGEFG